MGITREQFEMMQKKLGWNGSIDNPAFEKVIPKSVSGSPVQMDSRPKTKDVLNKTEKAYLAYLRALRYPWIGIQCIKLRLGDNCQYTPDFWVVNANGRMEAHEVKGFMRDDARVKLMAAASMYPMFDFRLIYKQKAKDGGGWDISEAQGWPGASQAHPLSVPTPSTHREPEPEKA